MSDDKDALIYLANVRIDELDAENAKLRELVRCGECIHFERCPMRKGDGSGYCWQAKRKEAVRHAKDD